MSGVRFPWVRRWAVHRDPTVVDLPPRADDRGAPLEAWSDGRCLVLLGEGGLGKSTELEVERDRAHAGGGVAVLCDLAVTTDRADVRNALPVVTPGTRTTVLIDAFDEVFDDVNDIADVLISYLESLDRESVMLRIASRPVVWSSRLEDALNRLWPDAVTVLGLQPISPADISAAALAVLGDDDAAEAFVTAIQQKDLWSLATRPITLRFLLSAFHEHGTVGDDRLAIHRDGIAHLAAEGHDRRVDRGRTGAPVPQRIAAARRLAALSMLGGDQVIATRPLPAAQHTLDLDDVAGRDGVALPTLRDVAQSGLFRPAGPNQVTWTHRTVAEVLAADELWTLPLPALLTLLCHSHKPMCIAPQLTGVASWIALTHADLFAWLLEHDVEVLLNASLTDLPDEQRARVAHRVIARIVAGRPFDWRAIDVPDLRHPGLGAALRRPLGDGAVPAIAKADLVQLARRADERSIDTVLMDLIQTAAPVNTYEDAVSLGRWAILALDGRDPSRIATLSVIALAPSTNPWIRADLLERLYPNALSTHDVLAVLPGDALAGFDSTFLGVVRRVQDAVRENAADLVEFLDWLRRQPDDAHFDNSFFGEAFDDAANASARQLDNPQVRGALARLLGAHARVTHHARVPSTLRDGPVSHRRSMLAVAASEVRDSAWLVQELGSELADRDDFAHYLALLEAAGPLSGDDRPWQANAAEAAFRHIPVDDWETASNEAKSQHPALADFIEATWGAPRREIHAKTLATGEERQERRTRGRSADRFDKERLDAALTTGNWPLVARELTRPADDSVDSHVSHTMERLISTLPTWQLIDSARRDKAIEVAAVAVHSAPPATSGHWVGDAIALVAAARPGLLDAVPGDRWLTLLPTLLDTSSHHDTSAYVIRRAALHDRAAADAIITATLRKDVASGHALVLDRLDGYEPAGFPIVLVALASDDGTDPHSCGRLLQHALHGGSTDAAAAAVDIIRSRPAPQSAEVLDRDDTTVDGMASRRWHRAIAAGAAMATAPAEAVMGISVLELLTTDWEFTAAVLDRVGLHPSHELLPALSADELATFFLWLDQHVVVPRHAPGRGFSPSPVHESLNTVLETIGRREDGEAAAALARIAAVTKRAGIDLYARRVERATLAATWRPIPLEDVRQVLRASGRRVIETAEQLAAAVTEALADYNHDLARSATLRQRLWKSPSDAECDLPTNEDGLSAELQQELSARLAERVMVHREVRIESRVGKQSASDVDLLVTVTGARHQPISCIIELKASWYKSLIGRVRSQLTARYLCGPAGDVGVFVVMWFAAAEWCDSDPRKRKARKSLKRLQRDLDVAVGEVGNNGKVHGIVLDCSLERHE